MKKSTEKCRIIRSEQKRSKKLNRAKERREKEQEEYERVKKNFEQEQRIKTHKFPTKIISKIRYNHLPSRCVQQLCDIR